MRNRFGLFIHWGIYALTGAQEQAFSRLDMDRAEYEALATRFNPTRYDPEEWVRLAKEAGMTYLCFTTKHHDGFCMWDTKYTDYNIMNTPYGKDVLKELANACAKYDMKLSLYYSNPDWHCPYGYNPSSTHQWKAVNPDRPDFPRYKQYIRNQITELLTQYGPIYTLFWDIPPREYDPEMNALVRRLQPDILINDRGFSEGDFSTPEREIPEGSRFPSMTEACESVGEQSWGYRHLEDYHTKRYLTCAIDKIMAMGGSYLLNIGPTAEGEFPPEAKALLKKVGDWYRRMEGCLEDTEPDSFDYEIPRQKYIALTKNGRTYLHFYEGLVSTGILLKKYPRLPASVRLLNTGKAIPWEERLMPTYLSEGGKGTFGLHLYGIPADELADEPVVLEVDFG